MEREITPQVIEEHGLSPQEYEKIKEILDRKPTFTELGIFSVMWSEHCSYKSSLKYLSNFPTQGEVLLREAGEENAGAIEIDEDLAVVFKMESHNHPSAIEPFQGAATGVGGILRDVFAMGAYPIAVFDSLKFGDPESAEVKHLVQGVVSGISSYGNCFGVPTVGGELFFDDAYNQNPLVNVMAVGLVKKDNLMSATAAGEGTSLMIVGAPTGSDGIHGATFASDELDEDSKEDRPSVQIGDPFLEKLLLEATKEVIEKDLVIGIQDMGAAGITSSVSETAESGGVGVYLNLDKVPQRGKDLTAYEMMLSESQERMLFVVKKGKEDEVRDVLQKWDLHSSVFGTVEEHSKKMKVEKDGEIVADIPISSLVAGEGAPVYDRPAKRPSYLSSCRRWKPAQLNSPSDLQEVAEKIISNENIVSKEWVWEQYDHQVGTNTALLPGADASVLRLKNKDELLAATTDSHGRYCYLNPYKGGQIIVAEATRNLTAVGANPLAITNCLNFGSPEDPEVFWTFKKIVKGIGEACEKLNTPVTGGNVSFYNENPEGEVLPSPVIGMMGVIQSHENIVTPWFKKEGDLIFLVGETNEEIGGSIYQDVRLGESKGDVPSISLTHTKQVNELVRELHERGLLNSVHDLSDGGLMVALSECCVLNKRNQLGAKIENPTSLRDDLFLFSESQSRFLISIDKDSVDELKKVDKNSEIHIKKIGKVIKNEIIYEKIGWSVKRVSDLYYSTLKERVE